MASYGKERHPITPVMIRRDVVSIGDGGGVGEKDESVEGEDGADKLEDGFDLPFGVVLL